MATAYPELIMQDAAAATGNGIPVGIGGPGMRYANSLTKLNANRFPVKFKIRLQLMDTVAGTATATVIVEESNDNSSYNALATIVLLNTAAALASARARLFSSQKRYVRARISAISGGTSPTLNAYMVFGGGGT